MGPRRFTISAAVRRTWAGARWAGGTQAPAGTIPTYRPRGIADVREGQGIADVREGQSGRCLARPRASPGCRAGSRKISPQVQRTARYRLARAYPSPASTQRAPSAATASVHSVEPGAPMSWSKHMSPLAGAGSAPAGELTAARSRAASARRSRGRASAPARPAGPPLRAPSTSVSSARTATCSLGRGADAEPPVQRALAAQRVGKGAR